MQQYILPFASRVAKLLSKNCAIYDVVVGFDVENDGSQKIKIAKFPKFYTLHSPTS